MKSLAKAKLRSLKDKHLEAAEAKAEQLEAADLKVEEKKLKAKR